MNIEKLEQLYKFLSDYNNEINENASDNLKCRKCKNILVNACQIPCGCQYCHDCVNEMIENGVEYCPGNTDDCKNQYLSHNQLDYRANRKISKLVMKCPEEMCLHECELIDMGEHLRICGKKSGKCPFSDLGCDDKKISNATINEHCQLANFNHSKILIEIIDNIRNEIDGLKMKEEKNKKEVEKLVKNLKVKDEIIDSINEEVKLIKLEKEKLWEEFKSLKENLGNKIEEISVEMKNENFQSIKSKSKETKEIKMENAKLAHQVNISKVELENKIGKIDEKIERENERMKMERDEHKRECEILKKNLEIKTKEILVEIQNERQARIESINKETKSMKASMNETSEKSERKLETRINKETNEIKMENAKLKTRMNELIKIIDKFGYAMIEWKIDKLDERRNKNECIWSEFFTAMIKPYKLGLSFYANGFGDFIGNGCSIFLRIYPGAENKNLPLPLKADVTIKIINQTNPNASQSITKFCQINQPLLFSDSFDYSNSNLTKSGVMQGNCWIVECFVNFK